MRRAFAVCVVSFFIALPSLAATFSVDDLGDAPDATPGDGLCATAGGVCTLRAAIAESNALGGTDTIEMTVAGTIAVFTPLPDIRDNVVIDGTTAPGYASAPVVIVEGRSPAYGVVLSAPSRLAGLEIHGFDEAQVLVRHGTSGTTVVERCYIGAISGGSPGRAGVLVDGGPARIGSPVPGGGNVISRNEAGIVDAAGTGTRIMNNFIGTDPYGTAELGNIIGIRVTGGGARTKIGLDASTVNVISGNIFYGVLVEGDEVVIGGNRIGTDVTGLSAIPNGNAGIYDQGLGGTQIGTPEYPNIISGNDGPGVLFDGLDVTIENNWIGVGADGTTAIPNDTGVAVTMDSLRPFRHASIGTAASGNVISGNRGEGIAAGPNAAYLTIENNYIGLNATGNVAVPNVWNGVSLTGGSNFTLRANTVAGNTGNGIRLDSAGVITIEDNRLGTDPSGTAAFPNGESGVELHGVTNAALAENLISGNALAGVEINGVSNDVTLTGNVIGRSSGNLAPLSNGEEGIRVADDASGVTIGVPGNGNVIASNGGADGGVSVTGNANALVRANSIFDNGALGIDLGVTGVTSNDVLDTDGGPSGLQNFPLLSSVLTSAAASWISGTLNSTPSTAFAIDFFSNPLPDPSSHGEGQTYLGSLDVTTDGSGAAAFTFTGPALTPGAFVSATATATTGTSEFSADLAAAPVPAVAFSSANYTVNEGDGTATITVTRSGDLTAISTVDYATAALTASAGADYESASGTLTFAPGVTTQSFVVPIIDDTDDEGAETIALTLTAPSSATLGSPSAATLTIAASDPTLTIADSAVAEGDTGTTLNFTVSLLHASSAPISVEFTTTDVTATAGVDYTATSGTLTIPPGATSGTISIAIDGDTAFEADETFVVELTNAVNAAVADAQATGTIVNDDVATAELTITKSAPATATVGDEITYAIVVANAGPDVATNVVITDTLPADTTLVSATTTAGACSGTATVTCNAGTVAAGETVNVNITARTDAAATIANTATVTASEADPNEGNNSSTATTNVVAPTPEPSVEFSAAAYGGTEGDGASTITVTRSGDLSGTSTVDYTTSDGTATSGADYVAASGTLTFGPGVAAQTFTITVLDDAAVESGETIALALSSPSGATLGAPSAATFTIVDDDVPTITGTDLTITKTAPPTATAGDAVPYDIVVSNAGPIAATNVVVTDVLPAGTSFVSATSSAGTCSGATTITCSAGTLAPGAAVVVRVTLRATSAATITNTATVSASETDPNTANNAAAATTTVAAAAAIPTIPTLSESMLIALATLLAAAGVVKARA